MIIKIIPNKHLKKATEQKLFFILFFSIFIPRFHSPRKTLLTPSEALAAHTEAIRSSKALKATLEVLPAPPKPTPS